ncbi:hypothetical protein PINS_up002753 [Pythium insidiosum]|nr:hypothetical protein PINS_up002753 [Pythium insidiosum]
MSSSSSTQLSDAQRKQNARAYVAEVSRRYIDNRGCNVLESITHDALFEKHGIHFDMLRPVEYYVSPSTSGAAAAAAAAAVTRSDNSNAAPQRQQQQQKPLTQQHLEFVFFDPLTMTRPTKPALCFCRCGIVEYALHFATSEERIVTHDVALKILKRAELARQHDDPVREVDAMSALRAPGFVGSRRSAKPCERGQQLIPRWRTIMDGGNVYTAAEFASNGSLIQFAHTYLQNIHFDLCSEEGDRELIDDIDVSMMKQRLSRLWRRTALSIFAGIASAVAWMHSRRVAHLDLDPYNVVVDGVGNPLIVDFGSAERWRDDDDDDGKHDDETPDARAMVGRGRPIPCKRVFAAPELLVHNRTFKTSMGVRGDAADCWALGSMVRGSVRSPGA